MTRLKLFSQSGAELEISAFDGQKLSEAIWLSGALEPVALCGGLGLCGRCRVRFLSPAPAPEAEDLKFFSEQEIEFGWRLACHHDLTGESVLCLELPELNLLDDTVAAPPQVAYDCVLGIDFGTTTVQWRAVAGGKPEASLACGSFANPQAGAGADIISRLEYALNPHGLNRLSCLGRKSIAAIVESLRLKGLAPARACLAANTAMTSILLARDISGLVSAPYSLPMRGNEMIELQLPGEEQPLLTLIPPLPAPFVGGDLSAGLLALLQNDIPKPFILADLGTNAEFALMDGDENLYLASAPLGPALEGIGPANGQQAGPGVITSFTLNVSGLFPHYFDNEPTPKSAGISATGYISLLAILLKIGLLTAGGQFNYNSPTPLATKIATEIFPDRLIFPCGLMLTSWDVELLLKVKAAMAVAFQRLLQAASLHPGQIAGLWLAGALGTYSLAEDLEELGLIPQGLAVKTRVCGNTALQGACILACVPEKSEFMASLCSRAHILQMAEDPAFMQDYLAAMRWGNYAV